MSTLVENVAKVKSAHAALSASIEAKGVSVPAGTKLTGMPALVDQIQTGGGGGEDYGYLTFTAEEATTLTLKQNGGIAPHKLLKSTDGVTWTKWENPSTNGIVLNAGESVYLKDDEDALNRTSTSNKDFNSYSSTGRIKCNGSLMPEISLNPGTNNYSYFVSKLFINCTTLTKAPELPATTLANSCYNSMFENCTSLTQAPELPATTLANSCYQRMFYSCASLTQAPELPATTLANNCYYEMFWKCTSLTQAPELPATNLAEYCYQSMLEETSLTKAPELPATNLAIGCYRFMFKNCKYLTQAPELPATNLAEYCYNSTLEGTSLTQAPELPATTLADYCYHYMFQNCTSLKRIKMNASSGNWGSYMFNGCTSLELVDMTGSIGVPQLQSVYNFNNTNDTYKVVVPDSLYDTWINATNWASIASHIMKQSDWNAAHPDDQL